LALAKTERRVLSRYAVNVALDVIVLRSGVPENLPGRCTDLSEGGVSAMVAGELSAGQQVAVEFRLPKVAVPVRARALVRYQGRLHYGFEFIGLAVDQRELIRYWAFQAQPEKAVPVPKPEPVLSEWPVPVIPPSTPKIRVSRRWFNLLLAGMLLIAVVGWWKWQHSWNELESTVSAAKNVPLRVAPETMEMRIVSRVEPVYPEEARQAGTQGLAVLDAIVAADGTVAQLRPVSGDNVLVKAATDAVRSWKFEPYQLSGHRVEVETTIAVEFRLN
jgi:protein TonB